MCAMSPRRSQKTSEQTDQPPELDRILLALSAEPRRQVISSLMDRPRSEPVTLPDAVIGDNMESAKMKQFEISLYHNHLPMLAESGIIAWAEKEDQHIVTRGDHFDEAATILEYLQTQFEI